VAADDPFETFTTFIFVADISNGATLCRIRVQPCID
jgi:hypothetical protein